MIIKFVITISVIIFFTVTIFFFVNNHDNKYSYSSSDIKELSFVDYSDFLNQDNNAYNLYKKHKNIWEKNNAGNYHFIFIYGAHSSNSGKWEIFIRKNKVVSIIDNRGNTSTKNQFSSFTMSSLFKFASYSFKNTLNSPYIFKAEYDSNIGYVKLVTKEIKNTLTFKKYPTDTTYRYEVILFEFIE